MEDQINELSSYKYDGVKYYYLTPPSKEFSFDFVAKHIKVKDFNIFSIAVVCECADEAENIMQQLGKRSVACLLLNRPNKMLDLIVRLWTQGVSSYLSLSIADGVHTFESKWTYLYAYMYV